MRYAPSRRNVGDLRLKSLEVLMNGGSECAGGILLILQLNVALRPSTNIPLA